MHALHTTQFIRKLPFYTPDALYARFHLKIRLCVRTAPSVNDGAFPSHQATSTFVGLHCRRLIAVCTALHLTTQVDMKPLHNRLISPAVAEPNHHKLRRSESVLGTSTHRWI